jgi:hypothetical protein
LSRHTATSDQSSRTAILRELEGVQRIQCVEYIGLGPTHKDEQEVRLHNVSYMDQGAEEVHMHEHHGNETHQGTETKKQINKLFGD